jgi:hypothetical protein
VTADYVRDARHSGVKADHAIVVHPGITSPPSILDTFCAHHANRGVDVWELDARFSPEGCAEGVPDMGPHVAQSARLPVFIVGSVRSAGVIYRALETSDGLFGAVLIGNAWPPVLPEQLAQSFGPNTKPVLYVIGDAGARSGLTAARADAGPVEVQTHPDDVNRLMLTKPAALSDAVLEWCLRQLSNHLNPTWRFE